MKYRKLGNSDLEVSEISLGSWLTYGVGVEADKARACLAEAFDQGINFIDTANVYGRGAAETFLGEALKGARARFLRACHEGLFSDERHRPRAVASADREATRRVAEATADRLGRSLPVPPLRLGHAARGDDGSADSCGRERQGPRTSAFRSGPPSRSGQLSILARSAASRRSSQVSRNIPCCGASRRRK